MVALLVAPWRRERPGRASSVGATPGEGAAGAVRWGKGQGGGRAGGCAGRALGRRAGEEGRGLAGKRGGGGSRARRRRVREGGGGA